MPIWGCCAVSRSRYLLGLIEPLEDRRCLSAHGDADPAESERTLHRALDIGVTFLDTANAYGLGHNEELIGRVLKERRDEIVLATKFGIAIDKDGNLYVADRWGMSIRKVDLKAKTVTTIAGVRPGDLVLRVDERETSDLEALRSSLERAEQDQRIQEVIPDPCRDDDDHARGRRTHQRCTW